MKNTFILSYFNKPVAVIQVNGEDSVKTFEDKLKQAIIEEVSADADGQFELKMQRLGDYGETTNLVTKYAQDGFLVRDVEFTLMKTVCY
jgi:hypothetical protein